MTVHMSDAATSKLKVPDNTGLMMVFVDYSLPGEDLWNCNTSAISSTFAYSHTQAVRAMCKLCAAFATCLRACGLKPSVSN